jgi:hypothetical protein
MWIAMTLWGAGCSLAQDAEVPREAKELRIFCEATNHHAEVADPNDRIMKIVGEVKAEMAKAGLPEEGSLMRSFATMSPESRKQKVTGLVEAHGLHEVCRLVLEDLEKNG